MSNMSQSCGEEMVMSHMLPSSKHLIVFLGYIAHVWVHERPTRRSSRPQAHLAGPIASIYPGLLLLQSYENFPLLGLVLQGGNLRDQE